MSTKEGSSLAAAYKEMLSAWEDKHLDALRHPQNHFITYWHLHYDERRTLDDACKQFLKCLGAL